MTEERTKEMMMVVQEIVKNTIETLTDDDLQRIINYFFDDFYNLLSRKSMGYDIYRKALGNKKNSVQAKRQVPVFALKLYRKNDDNFVELMHIKAETLCVLTISLWEEMRNEEYSIEKVYEFSNDDIVNLVNQYLDENDSDNNEFDFEFFYMQLRLLGIPNIENRRQELMSSLGLVPAEDDAVVVEVENVEENMPVVKEKRAKQKKLTPEEKAAKHKAAEEAKKAKMLEEEQQVQIVETESVPEDNEEQLDEVHAIMSNKKTVEKEDVQVANEPVKKTSVVSKYKSDSDCMYIGVIKLTLNYYNFTPIGIFSKGVFVPFSENEISNLLPQSNRNNIMFEYSFYDEGQRKFMNSHFFDGQLVVLNCSIDALDEYKNPDGTFNKTGYKINAIDGINRGKICFMSDIGLYSVLPYESLQDDIYTKRLVRIASENLIANDKVLINMGEGFYAGPYVLNYNNYLDSFVISLANSDAKRYLNGFESLTCEKITIEPHSEIDYWFGYQRWIFYSTDNATSEDKDLISDKELLDSFKTSITSAAGLDFASLDVDRILTAVGNSQIVGPSIPENIRQSRASRLRSILTAEENLMHIFSDASDQMWTFLLNSNDTSQTEQYITGVIEKHPEIIDKFQGLQILQKKVENAQSELSQLEAQRKEMEAQTKTAQANMGVMKQVSVEEELSEEIIAKRNELEVLEGKLEETKGVVDLQDRKKNLEDEVKYFENHKMHLLNDAKDLQSTFVELVNGYSQKMADITFDGFMASKMLQAASGWEAKEQKEALSAKANEVNKIEAASFADEELVDYLVETIQLARPGYSKNTIINILTCMAQGFLTVFSGAPGCGKTSICNIVAQVTGLDNLGGSDRDDLNRYIPVSVERGWTSKRDFVGYYNPLTKSFEENNRKVYDGLRLLDMESKLGIKKWPFIILLDEANLSSMEYYWADFMNVCDDLSKNSSINLGNENVFAIPETLHFLATINNDHTTSPLSPRLIDRAWIVTLPKNNSIQYGQEITADRIKKISWDDIKRTFVDAARGRSSFDMEAQGIFDGIKDRLAKQDMYISPRIEIAIQKYWAVASRLMEDDEYGNSASIAALDFAIAQKILPKISGSDDEYKEWLEELRNYCNAKNLSYTADIISSIISKGNKNYRNYQFFF